MALGLGSTPRHLEPGVPISSTGLSCSLHTKGYVSYRTGSAFGTLPRCRML
jgi:hypothetical protein